MYLLLLPIYFYRDRHKTQVGVSLCHFISFPRWICTIYFLFSALFLFSLQFGLFLSLPHTFLFVFFFSFYFSLLPPLHFCPFLPFLFFPPSREGSVCFLFILVGGNDSSLGLNPKQPYGKRAQFAAVLCVCAQKHAKIFSRFKEWSVCEKPG